MKRIISITAALCLLVLSCVNCFATTYVYFGDFKLAINGDGYLLGGYRGTEATVTPPTTAYGKPVTGIAEDFIENCETEPSSIVIPDGYESIGNFAFYNCSSLESVAFPSTLTFIGTMAFSGCTTLSSADLSSSQIKTIPYGCFSGCTELSSVSLPDGLEKIGDYAFSQSGVSAIVLPQSVTEIGSLAFNKCKSLSSVTLPDGILKIGEKAFYGENQLTTISLPASLKSIGAYAFYPRGLEGGQLTVECQSGTYAADYAYSNFLNMNAKSNIGDADGNGKVNINDVTFVQLYLLGLADFTYYGQENNADANRDNVVNLRDATTIQLKLANRIDFE